MYLNGCTMESVNQILYDLADENERKDYELSFVSCCTDEMLKKLESNAALKGKKVFQTEITTQSWDQMLPQRFLLLVIDKEVYLCSHDEICLPEDCSYLFSGGFIGDDCDYDLAEFKKINLEGVDASEVKSMAYMFCKCPVSEEINLTGLDTSNVKDMSYMFSHCTIHSLDLSTLDTSKVKYMSNMFEDSKFHELNLENFNTSKVTNMSKMFRNCETSFVNIRHFHTSRVRTMSGMFEDSSAKIEGIECLDTSNVTNMSHMFKNYQYLDETDLSGLDISKVKSMTGMFEGCRAYKLDLSNFDTSNVKTMSRMFYKCSVAQVDVSGFDTSCLTNALDMFYQCSAEKILMSADGQTDLKDLLGISKIVYS